MLRTLHRNVVLIVVFCWLFAVGAMARAQDDPAAPGMYGASNPPITYDFGNHAFRPSNLGGASVEVRAIVYYPVTRGTNNVPAGTFPVVLIMHGRHPTLVRGGLPLLTWTAREPLAGDTVINSYQGYNYLAQLLATQGFIAVSISTNGVNGNDAPVADRGALARATLIRRHLMVLRDFNTAGRSTIGRTTQTLAALQGHFNFSNIGLLGHSRGAEAVIKYVTTYPNGGANAFTVNAVMSWAPTDVNTLVLNNVPFGVLLPYCDGDVTDLEGVHFFDRARYNVRNDPAPKYMFVVMGANHNFYNTEWSPGSAVVKEAAIDDWCLNYSNGGGVYTLLELPRSADPYAGCTITMAGGDVTGSTPNADRFGENSQRTTGQAIACAFFNQHLLNNNTFQDILQGNAKFPDDDWGDDILVTYHPPAASRLVVDNFLVFNQNDVIVPVDNNLLRMPVETKLLDPYEHAEFYDVATMRFQRVLAATDPPDREPHLVDSTPLRGNSYAGLPSIRCDWDDIAATYASVLGTITKPLDVSSYRALQFRVSVNFSSDLNDTAELLDGQDFQIGLVDDTGRLEIFQASDISARLGLQNPLFYPPGQQDAYAAIGGIAGGQGPIPHLLMNMIRIPLSDFVFIDLTKLTNLYFFMNDTTLGEGSIAFTDIMFAN